MRNLIIQHLQTKDLGAYKLSERLPWTEDNSQLYEINPKVIYVDEAQIDEETIVEILNGSDVVRKITEINLYVVNDAKTLPQDYDAVKNILLDAKNTTLITDAYEREVDVSTSFNDDAIVTNVLYRFAQIT